MDLWEQEPVSAQIPSPRTRTLTGILEGVVGGPTGNVAWGGTHESNTVSGFGLGHLSLGNSLPAISGFCPLLE